MAVSKKLVVLTGAGISAESGLKTFRDSDGLWEGYNLEDVATPRAWKKDPERVLEFYNMRRANVLAAKPNKAHEILAALESAFEVQIITQNIDDLHERAGSHNVLHLHGEILKMRSEKREDLVYPITSDIKIGDTAADGSQLRPDIVWFEEPVPLIEEAARMVSQADLFLVVGTSLVVYPAAGLVNFAPMEIPKFIVDRNIPVTYNIKNLRAIEEPATVGMVKLRKILEEEFAV